jgi:hypothetical protein
VKRGKANAADKPLRKVFGPTNLVGLYNLNSVDPYLESIWFQPLKLTCDILVSQFAFKWVNLYRYNLDHFAATREDITVGLCTSIQVDP